MLEHRSAHIRELTKASEAVCRQFVECEEERRDGQVGTLETRVRVITT